MKRKVKKNNVIIAIIIVLFIVIIPVIIVTVEKKEKLKRQKRAEAEIGFQEEIEVEVYSDKKFEHIINEPSIEIVSKSKIDTTELKEEKIKFNYIYNDEEFTKSVIIRVVDTTKPTIFAQNSYTMTKGSNRDFLSYILSGDNYDNKPKREIIGDYNPNEVGTYNLTYHIEDSSGNVAEKDFTVTVKEPPKPVKPSTSTTTPSVQTRIAFSDVYQKHKTSKTEIGIDVSKWQEKIDFDRVKKAGCEFVIIRLGHQKGINGELIIDPYFKENIKNAKKAGLKIGVYIYTYAKDKKDVIKQAKWALDNVKDYKLDLGISYDWESWSSFNDFNLSYYSLTELANTFIDYVKDKGYKGMLYSSKYYLENIWLTTDNDVWLAHYTPQTNYGGEYRLWQRTSNGSIDGIDNAVDIDILYNE